MLNGKVAIITGGSRGLGAAIAEHYLGAGASLMLCARDEAQLSVTKTRLDALAKPGQEVAIFAADVRQNSDIDAVVAATRQRFGRIDILVNNAGVYGPMGLTHEVAWDDWTAAITINLLGTVAFCRAVAPVMIEQGGGRIINISGGGATSPLPHFSAYATAKAGIVRFTETLALELAPFGITVNAVAPGALATRLLEQVIAAGADAVGADFHARMIGIAAAGGDSLAKAAELVVGLAAAAGNGITGRLISAKWDPWAQLPSYADQIAGSDIYTLRRIVPEDRGKSWGGPK